VLDGEGGGFYLTRQIPTFRGDSDSVSLLDRAAAAAGKCWHYSPDLMCPRGAYWHRRDVGANPISPMLSMIGLY